MVHESKLSSVLWRRIRRPSKGKTKHSDDSTRSATVSAVSSKRPSVTKATATATNTASTSRPTGSSSLPKRPSLVTSTKTKAETETSRHERSDGPEHKVNRDSLTRGVSILMDLIGARDIPVNNMETYCVVQSGSKEILHRTKPYAPKLSKTARMSMALRMTRSPEKMLAHSLQNPIWTIRESSLFSFTVTAKDIQRHKCLTITIWARPRRTRLRRKAVDSVTVKGTKHSQVLENSNKKAQLIAVARIPFSLLLQNCTSQKEDEERRCEHPLQDESGNQIKGGPSLKGDDDERQDSTLAYRCRIATNADLAFVTNWEKHASLNLIWKEADVLSLDDCHQAGTIMTDLTKREARCHQRRKSDATNSTNPASSTTTQCKHSFTHSKHSGMVRVKPFSDPTLGVTSQYITKTELKAKTQEPSQYWVHAGSTNPSYGSLYIEVLSAHDLPTDLVGGARKMMDPFCAIVYGDCLVQTDVIHDESNPHWLPWTQRAFVFHVQHSSEVLFLSVFSFKQKSHQHKPIGRVELNTINLQSKTTYNLDYELYDSTNVAKRKAQGTIRLRVRFHVEKERNKLFATLQQQPPVYVNMKRKQSLQVARYTIFGAYNDYEKFRLSVLQSYIDEISERYLKRMIYAIQDGGHSLICWKKQVQIFGIGIPLYSMILFVGWMWAVENPEFIPSMFLFSCTLLSWVQMQLRMRHPSPFQRCHSFFHFLRIAVLGKSEPRYKSILANEGIEEIKRVDEFWQKRRETEKEFDARKKGLKKEIEEAKHEKVETTSEVIPLELLVMLGKLQAYARDTCKMFRAIHAIVTWEYSNFSFLITLGLLFSSIICLFLPWKLFYRWIGHVIVVLFLGPQNWLVDILMNRESLSANELDKLKKELLDRRLKARCKQEDTLKLKIFRRTLFGKYAALVPSVLWTPHQDFPLPSSTAKLEASETLLDRSTTTVSRIAGQQLHGKMIPRTDKAQKISKEEFQMARDCIADLLSLQEKHIRASHHDLKGKFSFSGIEENNESEIEEGFDHDSQGDSDCSSDYASLLSACEETIEEENLRSPAAILRRRWRFRKHI